MQQHVTRESSIGSKGRLLNWRLQRPTHSTVTTGPNNSAMTSTASGSNTNQPFLHQRFLPPVPLEVCMILKYLVEYLLKHKLHKNELFLLDGKAPEKKKLLRSIKIGDLPAKLSNYSSRSISFVINHLLTAYYAPLFPYELFHDVAETIETQGSREQWEPRLRGLMLRIVPERRVLLESLLLLLYKLSLKASARSNAQVLGEAVGSILARPSEEQLIETMSTRRAIGIFLIEHAPLILHKTLETPTAAMSSTAVDNEVVDQESDEENMDELSQIDEESVSELVFDEEVDRILDEPIAYDAARIATIRSASPVRRPRARSQASPPSRRPSRSLSPPASPGATARAATKKLVSFAAVSSAVHLATATRRHTALPLADAQLPPASPLLRHQAPSNDRDVELLRSLFMAILKSSHAKDGLFVATPGDQEEVKGLHQLLNLRTGVQALATLPLESFSVHVLASVAMDHLQQRLEPMLGYWSRDQLLEISSLVAASSATTKELGPSIAALKRVVQTRSEPQQELLLLLCACVRLAMDAGTDIQTLSRALRSCIVAVDKNASDDSIASAAAHVAQELFTHMHLILSADSDLGSTSPVASSAWMQHVQAALSASRMLHVVVRVVCWIVKCRMRARRTNAAKAKARVSTDGTRKQQLLQSSRSTRRSVLTHDGEQGRLSWSEAANGAALIVEMLEFLLDQTREKMTSSRPLYRLYLECGDSVEEEIILDKVCANSKQLNLRIFSPYSVAMALKKLLSTVFQPLVPYDLLVHHTDSPLVATEHGAGVKDASDLPTELNIWRFEAMIMKELPPLQKQIIQLLFRHLDMLTKQETSRSGMQEAHQVTARMLFHPPEAEVVNAGDFCARVLVSKFYLDRRPMSLKAAAINTSSSQTAGSSTTTTVTMFHKAASEVLGPRGATRSPKTSPPRFSTAVMSALSLPPPPPPPPPPPLLSPDKATSMARDEGLPEANTAPLMSVNSSASGSSPKPTGTTSVLSVMFANGKLPPPPSRDDTKAVMVAPSPSEVACSVETSDSLRSSAYDTQADNAHAAPVSPTISSPVEPVVLDLDIVDTADDTEVTFDSPVYGHDEPTPFTVNIVVIGFDLTDRPQTVSEYLLVRDHLRQQLNLAWHAFPSLPQWAQLALEHSSSAGSMVGAMLSMCSPAEPLDNIPIGFSAALEINTYLWQVFTLYSDGQVGGGSSGIRFEGLVRLCRDCHLADVGDVAETHENSLLTFTSLTRKQLRHLWTTVQPGHSSDVTSGDRLPFHKFYRLLHLLSLRAHDAPATMDPNDKQQGQRLMIELIVNHLYPFAARSNNSVQFSPETSFHPLEVSDALCLLNRRADLHDVGRACLESVCNRLPWLELPRTRNPGSDRDLLSQTTNSALFSVNNDPSDDTIEQLLTAVLERFDISPAFMTAEDVRREFVHLTRRNRQQLRFTWALTQCTDDTARAPWLWMEIAECVLRLGMAKLSHPCFEALYGTHSKRMEAVLDVWGLADPSIIATWAP